MKNLERLSDWAEAARPWLLMILVAPIVIPALVIAAPVIGIKLLLDHLPEGAGLIAGALLLLGAIYTAVYFIGSPVLVLLGLFVGVVILLVALKIIAFILSDF